MKTEDEITAESFKRFVFGFESTVTELSNGIFELCKKYHQQELLKLKIEGAQMIADRSEVGKRGLEKLYPNVVVKKYNNVKNIMVNIKEGESHSPTCIQSLPSAGIVQEYSDRYEWDVITEKGLMTIKQYKRDFVWAEFLYE